MHRPPSPATVALIVLAATTAACASPSGPGGSNATPPQPSSASASRPTDLAATDEPLAPGRYSRSGFEPPITFELGGGWRAVQLLPGFFDVQQDVGSPHVIAVQFARVGQVFGPDRAVTASDAAAAADAVRGNPGLTVVESSESRIGGLTASQVTVENAGQAHARIMQVPPGPLGIDPGRRLWIAFFDTDHGLLAIMIGGSTERWDAALAAAEPVLESVMIGE